jgi:hypothetical protein
MWLEQLSKMCINYTDVAEIRSKDGVSVYRVHTSSSKSYVLKCFQNESDRREIKNYDILRSLGMQTIHITASTDCAILMEDIMQSSSYRLGVADDLNNTSVAIAIAKWYQQLHIKGKEYIRLHGTDMYDETDSIKQDNIYKIAEMTQTYENSVWERITSNFNQIKNKISSPERTLTYNDFYYTNLIVTKNMKSAFMFDYNLLGKGYVYSDIRNVTSALGEQAKAAFLTEYGGYDENEKIIDDVAGALVTLHFACCRSHIPKWADKYIEQIENGELYNAVERLLQIC